MNDTILAINADMGRVAADRAGGSLEDRIKASMRAVRKGNWLETDEGNLFRAGVGGALLAVGADSPDGNRIVRSMQALNRVNATLNAVQAGVPVDFEQMDAPDGDILPLLGWWRETADSREGG